MLEYLMKALAEGNVERDGAVTRTEFDTATLSDVVLSPNERELMVSFVEDSIPSGLKYMDASGRVVITFFDSRGRATTAPVKELDDGELLRVATENGYEYVQTSEPHPEVEV